jgi:hypothetical protein
MPLGNIVGTPLINGVSYAHADIVLEILGTPVVGCTGIDYADPQEITANHSTGTLPTSVGFGAVTPEGTITLTLEAIQSITAVAPQGRIQNIPFFSVGVNYVTEGGAFVRHSLKKCRFKGRSVSSTTGNSQIEETLELFVADIDYRAF